MALLGKDSTIENLIASNSTGLALALHAPNRPSLKYSDLIGHMKYVKTCLNHEGIGRLHRVAVVLPNGPEMASAFIAVSSMSVCAPLNPSYTEKEFEFYLTDLNVRTVLILEGMDSPVRKVAARMKVPVLDLCVDTLQPAGLFRIKGKTGFDPIPDEKSESHDVGLILHTSGTTARPKIVPLTQLNLYSSANNIRESLKLSQTDVCLNVMPLFHIHGLIAAVLSSLGAGGSVVCTSGFEALIFFNCIKQFNPTWYTAVPTIHQSVLSSIVDFKELIGSHKFRFARSSSASLPSQVMLDLEEALGAPVVEAFGMTEAAHQMACNPLPPHKRKPKSVGKAAGPEVGVMDPNGNLVEAGKSGEVVIRGANVTAGYENNPEANAVAFAYGWFHTGDQGFMDNKGYLFLTGRIKEMINRAGEKVSPLEVEEVLLKHPAVAEAVAFAVPHPTLGEEVAAAVILKKELKTDEESLQKHLKNSLSEFKIPQNILIVKKIPKGPTGKLQRMKLAELFKDELAQRIKKYAAPIDEIEKTLAEIWEKNLKIKKIGRDDNFFKSGGDSLRLTKTLYDIKKKDFDLELKDLYENQTIASLANAIRKREGVSKSTKITDLKRVSRSHEIPASAIQERFYFLFRLNPKNSGSNGIALSEIKMDVNRNWLQASLECIVKRHEIFRTVYKQVGDRVIQIITPPSQAKVKLDLTDISHLDGIEQKKALLEKASEISHKPFDLECDFPFRFELFKLGKDNFVLLKVIHHIAEDATTADCFYRELSENYRAIGSGQSAKAIEPEFQYADFAVWEKENITEDKIKDQLEYWKKYLTGAPELLHLPLDRPRQKVVDITVKTESTKLPQDLWKKAKELAQKEGATPSIFSMAVFSIFLHRYSGDGDVCIASPINLRHLKGFPDIWGPLISNFVIRSRYSAAMPFSEFLRGILDSAHGAYLNGDVSTEKLINLAGVTRTRSYSPLYQVMFDVVLNESDSYDQDSGLRLTKMEGHAGAQDIDLYGRLIEEDHGIRIQFSYNSEIFDGQTIQHFLEGFQNLFENVVNQPQLEIGRLALMGPKEKTKLLENFSRMKTTLAVPPGLSDLDARIYVLDGLLSPTPIGVFGEVYWGGFNESTIKNSKMEKEKCVSASFLNGPKSEIYRTGFSARFLHDGTLELKDNDKHRTGTESTNGNENQDPNQDQQKPYAEPANELEKTIATVWEKALKKGPISRHDDFFKLGGNSLYLIRILNNLTDLGFNLDLPDLYTQTTVEKLALLAGEKRSSEHQSAGVPKIQIPIQPRGDSFPCSFEQQKMWFLSQMEKGNGTYNMNLYFNIEGNLNVEALQKAVEELSMRHEIFRTVFIKKKSLPNQVVLKDYRLNLSLVDLSGFSKAEVRQEKARVLESLQKTSFNLADHPPVLATLIRLDQQNHIFCFIIDHILFDGWSAGLFLSELQVCYEAFDKKTLPQLNPLHAQYIDFAVWRKDLVQGPLGKAQTEFWKNQLTDHDFILDLPSTFTRPAVRSQNGRTKVFSLSDDLQHSLKAFCEKESVTPFITLFSVYKILLHCYTKQKKFIVGIPVSGRNSPEVEAIIGPFANLLAIPANLEGEPTFKEFVKKELDLYLAYNKNQDLPFEMVVETMKPKRSLSHTPLFQVLFNFASRFVRRELELSGLNVTPLKEDRPDKKGAKYDIGLLFIEGNSGQIRGEVEFSTDLFDDLTMNHFITHYSDLLKTVLNDSSRKVGSFQYSLIPKKDKSAA